MAGNGLKEFLSEIKEKDLARSHRFEVIIGTPTCMNGLENSVTNAITSIPGVQGATEFLTGQKNTPENTNTNYTSLMCEEAIFPGLLAGTRPFRYNNRIEQRATMLDYGGDSATFTFLCDRNWKVKKYFDQWMRNIVDPQTRTINYYDDYVTQIELYALDNKDQISQAWVIEDAFPRSIAPVSVAWSNTQFVRLPVTFTFKTWKIKETVAQRAEGWFARRIFGTTSADPNGIG